jgi:hypothetical protein
MWQVPNTWERDQVLLPARTCQPWSHTSSPANCQCYIYVFHLLPALGLSFCLLRVSLDHSFFSITLPVLLYIYVCAYIYVEHTYSLFCFATPSSSTFFEQFNSLDWHTIKEEQSGCKWRLSTKLAWSCLKRREVHTEAFWSEVLRSRWEVLLVLMRRRGIAWIELCEFLISSPLPPSASLISNCCLIILTMIHYSLLHHSWWMWFSQTVLSWCPSPSLVSFFPFCYEMLFFLWDHATWGGFGLQYKFTCK